MTGTATTMENGDDEENGGGEVRYLFDSDGRPIRISGDDDDDDGNGDDDITIGARNLTSTQSESWGLALQADREFERHVLTAGLAYDQSDTNVPWTHAGRTPAGRPGRSTVAD